MKENSVDVWDAFLNTLENRGVSSEWEVASEVQKELINYFKMKIDMGVVDGKTAFPSDLIWNEYVWRFPDEMREKLTEYAEQVLETDPNNGAAAKFLTIVTAGTSYDFPPDEFWDILERTTELLPNDVDICYWAFENASLEPLLNKGVVALERLFTRCREDEKPTLYQWLFRCCYDYLHVTARPNDFYKALESDDPLYERWTAVMGKIQDVFEEQLAQRPDAWEIIRMLTEIQEALGNTAAAEKVFKKSQKVYEKQLERDEDDRSALSGLANIHEKLGNIELASEYKVKADPSLGWVGQVLPDFSSPVVDLEGNPISLGDYRGKVVLLDFWAVWCGPCLGEIPRIKAVYEKYHGEGFEVIGVSLDEDAAVLREFITEQGIPWRQIFDGQKWAGHLVQQYGVHGIPAPFLMDREGKVISVAARGSLLEELVKAEIEGKKG